VIRLPTKVSLITPFVAILTPRIIIIPNSIILIYRRHFNWPFLSLGTSRRDNTSLHAFPVPLCLPPAGAFSSGRTYRNRNASVDRSFCASGCDRYECPPCRCPIGGHCFLNEMFQAESLFCVDPSCSTMH